MQNEQKIFGGPKSYFLCTPGLVLSYSKDIFIIFSLHSELSPRLTLHYQTLYHQFLV